MSLLERGRLNRLAEGIQKFRSEVFPQQSDLFSRLSGSQSPETLFITCSDSRVVPNLITQTDPGDLFHCRTIGNLIPPYGDEAGGVASVVEYAINVLKVCNIAVCGHSDCGAMKGALHPEKLESLPATKSWLRFADGAKKALGTSGKSQAGESEQLQTLTEQNVIQQIEHLETHPAVADALSRGELDIFGLVYNIGTGNIVAYDAASKRFLPAERDVLACATPAEYLKGRSQSALARA